MALRLFSRIPVRALTRTPKVRLVRGPLTSSLQRQLCSKDQFQDSDSKFCIEHSKEDTKSANELYAKDIKSSEKLAQDSSNQSYYTERSPLASIGQIKVIYINKCAKILNLLRVTRKKFIYLNFLFHTSISKHFDK